MIGEDYSKISLLLEVNQAMTARASNKFFLLRSIALRTASLLLPLPATAHFPMKINFVRIQKGWCNPIATCVRNQNTSIYRRLRFSNVRFSRRPNVGDCTSLFSEFRVDICVRRPCENGLLRWDQWFDLWMDGVKGDSVESITLHYLKVEKAETGNREVLIC